MLYLIEKNKALNIVQFHIKSAILIIPDGILAKLDYRFSTLIWPEIFETKQFKEF
jgi:hypothetical protein